MEQQTTAERAPSAAPALRRLQQWRIRAIGLHPLGSNHVFVARLAPPRGRAQHIHAIYKPAAGEQRLHDFPHLSLHRREAAAFMLARHLGWPLVPPTVLRGGPYGEGSWQAYIEHDPAEHYFALRQARLADYAPVAMFDVLTNNADRKGGAVLQDAEGRLWAIDNALTFNYAVEVRTVMHEFSGSPYPPLLLQGVARIARSRPAAKWRRAIADLLGAGAADALVQRARQMAERAHFPALSASRNVPFPLI